MVQPRGFLHLLLPAQKSMQEKLSPIYAGSDAASARSATAGNGFKRNMKRVGEVGWRGRQQLTLIFAFKSKVGD